MGRCHCKPPTGHLCKGCLIKNINRSDINISVLTSVNSIQTYAQFFSYTIPLFAAWRLHEIYFTFRS